MTVILIVVTLAIVTTIIVFAVKGNKKPDVPVTEPSGVTDTTKPDDVTPEPPKDVDTTKPDDATETDEPDNGDIHLDIGEKNDNGHEDAPGIVGDVVIIPGIKDESEGE